MQTPGSAGSAPSLQHCRAICKYLDIFGQSRSSLVHLDWKLDSLSSNCQLEKLPEGFCHIREQQSAEQSPVQPQLSPHHCWG